MVCDSYEIAKLDDVPMGFGFAVLKSLKTRIEKTEWLIDQIVYRLYGVTEEEIRVIEESERR